jgi:hypothetical protein
MEAFFLKAMADGLWAAGFPAILLAVAVWWFQRNQVILVAKLDAQSQTRIDEMRTLYGDRIKDLEKRSDACERDRDDMRKIIWSHLEQDAVLCKTCTHFNPSLPKDDSITRR